MEHDGGARVTAASARSLARGRPKVFRAAWRVHVVAGARLRPEQARPPVVPLARRVNIKAARRKGDRNLFSFCRERLGLPLCRGKGSELPLAVQHVVVRPERMPPAAARKQFFSSN